MFSAPIVPPSPTCVGPSFLQSRSNRLRPQTRTVDFASYELAGHTVKDLALRGLQYGRPLGTAPVVVVMGGITSRPHALGDGSGPGWWSALATSGLLDPTRQTILCPAMLGNGSGWQALERASWQQPFTLPPVCVSDLAKLVEAWLEGIGVDRPVTFIGASLGGFIGLALALRHPGRVEHLISVSAGFGPDGWGTGVRHLQRQLVRDGIATGVVRLAMNRARQLGMLTYRGRTELCQRFAPLEPSQDAPEVASYLQYNGRKFADTFSPHAFLLLSEAIDRCALGRDPEQLRRELEAFDGRIDVVGVPEDLLFPLDLQLELDRTIRKSRIAGQLLVLPSKYGHDAFLADQQALADLLVWNGVRVARV